MREHAIQKISSFIKTSYLYVLEFGNKYNGMNQGLGQLFQAFSEIASYL
jgi:hypothetical protein